MAETNGKTYETLLAKTGEAHKLMRWLDEVAGTRAGSTKAGNLWVLARLAGAALHWFLAQIVKDEIENQESDFKAAEAQAALDLMPPAPASAKDIKRAILAFLGSQELDHDDTNRGDFRPSRPPVLDGPPAADDPGAVAVAGQLARAGRPLPAELLALWSGEDRATALRWAEAKIGGSQAPPPAKVAARYLEDLDLEDGDDLGELLGWVGIPSAAEVDWEEDTQAVTDWAIAAHKHDRGETVEVPEAPSIVLPEEELFLQVVTAVMRAPMSRAEIVAKFRPDDFGITFALDAMVLAGELSIEEVGGRYKVPERPEGATPPARMSAPNLQKLAAQVAGRKVTELPTQEAQPDSEEALDEKASAEEQVDDADDEVAAGTPHEQGRRAREDGRSEADNPFDPEHDADAYMAWQEGWDEGGLA